VEEEWERTDAFHDRWKAKARDVLAKGEWRKRKLTKRVRGRGGARARGGKGGGEGAIAPGFPVGTASPVCAGGA
jgi:hypothetical protein